VTVDAIRDLSDFLGSAFGEGWLLALALVLFTAIRSARDARANKKSQGLCIKYYDLIKNTGGRAQKESNRSACGHYRHCRRPGAPVSAVKKA
jgi:hypothetical protein